MRFSGATPDELLKALRQVDEGYYSILQQQYRDYTKCVQLADTGYFRKRSQTPHSIQKVPKATKLRHMFELLLEIYDRPQKLII